MIVEMKGSQRAILLRSLEHFEKATKTAQKNCEAAFLPTMEADEQLSVIEEARDRMPEVDDAAREWEAVFEVNAVYRNALVVNARIVDKIRQSEKKETISTQDSDGLIAEMQTMLKLLGDERVLEDVLNAGRAESQTAPAPDPLQIDFTQPGDNPLVLHASTEGQG